MRHFFTGLIVFSLVFLVSTVKISAQELPSDHITTFIMQVRGRECCSSGSTEAVERWIARADELEVPLTLALRYDALQDDAYRSAIQDTKDHGHELAGYLEITPQLAAASGVTYSGSVEEWYQADQAFLIGYTQEERQKIIDTYMRTFREKVGSLPTTTVAWMIDAFSLRYLAENYGVTVHQITREQVGVDSYSLHGGPVHYPYYPSENWALIPAEKPSTIPMPLIVRQTVTDPVWNYGDTTSSFTSQPNDYDLAQRGFAYFTSLFEQAHRQPEPQTFTLLGLENSMPEKDQDEFLRQIEYAAQWQKKNSDNRILLSRELAENWNSRYSLRTYSGADKNAGNSSQAWWIETPTYRVRVRYEDNTLYLSDIRLYSQTWKDPYWQKPAHNSGVNIVPFLLDGARFFENGERGPVNWSDSLLQRKGHLLPTRIVIAENLSPEDLVFTRSENTVHFQYRAKTLAEFQSQSFILPDSREAFLSHPQLSDVMTGLQWKDASGKVAWQLVSNTTTVGYTQFTPVVTLSDLAQEREQRYYLLHPEIRDRPVDEEFTRVDVKNRYAMVGRNPIRLALWLKDTQEYTVEAIKNPTVTTDNAETDVEISPQNLSYGYVFIDLNRPNFGKVQVKVQYDEFEQEESIYFVPDCKHQIISCIVQPVQAWRFLQLKLEERRIASENF